MKKKNPTHYLEIKVERPCDESWDKMRPENGGRHCGQCEKVVRDFTEATDAELTGFFRDRPQHVCGRFRPEQLNRLFPFEPLTPKPQIGPWRSAALIGGLMLSGGVVAGQSVATPPPPPPPPEPSCYVLGEPALVGSRIVSGQVVDERGEGIIGAHVQVVGSSNVTCTDLDGYFTLPVPDGLKRAAINISIIGFETETLTFNKKALKKGEPVKVQLKDKVYTLEEVTVLGFAIPNKTEPNPVETFISVAGGITSAVHVVQPAGSKKEKSRSTNTDLKLFPNPFRETLNLRFPATVNGRYRVEVFELSGKRLLQRDMDLVEGDQQLALDLNTSDLPAATYLLRVLAPDGKVWTEQVIKAE